MVIKINTDKIKLMVMPIDINLTHSKTRNGWNQST